MHQSSRYPKFSETLKGSHRNFSTLFDNILPTGKLETLILCIIFFILDFFWKTEGFAYDFFGTVRQKNINGNSWYPPIMHTPNFVKHWRVHRSVIFVGTLRHKIFDAKTWYASSCPKCISILEVCPKNRRVPPRSLSALWD